MVEHRPGASMYCGQRRRLSLEAGEPQHGHAPAAAPGADGRAARGRVQATCERHSGARRW